MDEVATEGENVQLKAGSIYPSRMEVGMTQRYAGKTGGGRWYKAAHEKALRSTATR